MLSRPSLLSTSVFHLRTIIIHTNETQQQPTVLPLVPDLPSFLPPYVIPLAETPIGSIRCYLVGCRPGMFIHCQSTPNYPITYLIILLSPLLLSFR